MNSFFFVKFLLGIQIACVSYAFSGCSDFVFLVAYLWSEQILSRRIDVRNTRDSSGLFQNLLHCSCLFVFFVSDALFDLFADFLQTLFVSFVSVPSLLNECSDVLVFLAWCLAMSM